MNKELEREFNRFLHEEIFLILSIPYTPEMISIDQSYLQDTEWGPGFRHPEHNWTYDRQAVNYTNYPNIFSKNKL